MLKKFFKPFVTFIFKLWSKGGSPSVLSFLDVSQFLFLLRQMPARMEEMGSSDNWFCRCGVSQGYGQSFLLQQEQE